MQQTDKSTSYQGQWTQLWTRRLEAETWSLKFPFWWNSTDEKLWEFQWFFNDKFYLFFKFPQDKQNKTTRQLKVKRSGISLKMIKGGVKLKWLNDRLCGFTTLFPPKKKKEKERNMLQCGGSQGGWEGAGPTQDRLKLDKLRKRGKKETKNRHFKHGRVKSFTKFNYS